VVINEDRPPWARRMTKEREARSWSQADAVKAMRLHALEELPAESSLLRSWKRWESGAVTPNEFYQPIIAATFGTVTGAMFPTPARRDVGSEVLAMTGMDTLELVDRLQRSDLDGATIDALRITADRLCREYPYMPAEQLATEGQSWLRRIGQALGQRLTLNQHREILVQAGWIALLIGCVEYDGGDRHAETTRQAALSLGQEADHAEIQAWAHEIRAWMALTTGDYHGVVVAARAGMDAAPHTSVAAQLAAQEAKAWARIGDRRNTEVALDRGRRLLDTMPYPENLDHHFVVDPTKFDFYAMDCYRMLAEDKMAENLADEVIRAGTDLDGTERAPMRLAEARITLGVVAARRGDLEQAINQGTNALGGQRKSLPSLLMVNRDLTRVLKDKYLSEPATQSYLEHLQWLTRTYLLGGNNHGRSSTLE
jgi:hypothetical protein